LNRKEWPIQKEVSNAIMDKKRELKPKTSLSGNDLRYSLGCFREVRTVRNIMSPVTEKQSPNSETKTNASNEGLPSK